jgi:Heterokaryon incompatibility protein (HET)
LKSKESKYEALSYVWGDLKNLVEITLNDRPYRARKNLVAALEHLRYKDKNRVLWIDALCINQENIPEREAQVQLVAKIYSCTSRLII